MEICLRLMDEKEGEEEEEGTKDIDDAEDEPEKEDCSWKGKVKEKKIEQNGVKEKASTEA